MHQHASRSRLHISLATAYLGLEVFEGAARLGRPIVVSSETAAVVERAAFVGSDARRAVFASALEFERHGKVAVLVRAGRDLIRDAAGEERVCRPSNARTWAEEG